MIVEYLCNISVNYVMAFTDEVDSWVSLMRRRGLRGVAVRSVGRRGDDCATIALAGSAAGDNANASDGRETHRRLLVCLLPPFPIFP
jgi:hypothetical protein